MSALIEGVLNVMGALRMIDRPVRPLERPVWLDGGARVAAEGDGMFFAAVARGSYVSEGMVVGTLTDFVGRPSREVRAPLSGVVTFIRGVPSTWPGATLVALASWAEGDVEARLRIDSRVWALVVIWAARLEVFRFTHIKKAGKRMIVSIRSSLRLSAS